MNYSLVTYRTTDYRYDRYAVVPTMYVSDLLAWLTLSECAEIVSVVETTQYRLSDEPYNVPREWPSYQTCSDYILTVSLVKGR